MTTWRGEKAEVYCEEHKEEKRVYDKEYYQENKKRIKLREKRKRKLDRRRALKLLGGKCFICGKTKELSFHKKDGETHHHSTSILVLKKPKEFVLLCGFPCHQGVHWLMKVFNMDWGEIGDVIKIFEK